MQKILITGASGFVGSFLVEEALKRGLAVYAGVRSTSSRKYLQDKRINIFELDFGNLSDLRDRLQQVNFDYVVHNAGVVTVNDKQDFFKYNTELTTNFAEILQEVQPDLKKFTYISSAAAYGPADNQVGDFVKESDTPQPIDTYGQSKLKAENWLKNQTNFPYLIFRPTGVYGPRETEIFTFFKAFNQGLEGHIGRSPQKMAFIYVKDLAKVVLDGTLSKKVQKGYFVSDGNSYPTQDLGKYAAKILNKKPFLTLNLEKVKTLKAKNWQVDIAPLQNDFNFAPAYDLNKGLAETLIWYKENNWL